MGGHLIGTDRFSRRELLQTGIAALGGAWLCRFALNPQGLAAAPRLATSMEPLAGKYLEYHLGCPVLPAAAGVRVTFQKIREASMYLAVLEARFEGLVGTLTLHRTDRLASLMEWSESRKRFLPRWFAQQTAQKGSWRRRVIVFFHDRERYMDHKIHPHRSRKRPRKTNGRVMDDYLSAYVNWRSGAMGPLGPGHRYRIDNLPRKEPFSLGFSMASPDEARGLRPPSLPPGSKSYLVKTSDGRPISKAFNGRIEAWLDEELILVFAKATGVRWVGEITATLTARGRLPERELDLEPPPPLERTFWKI